MEVLAIIPARGGSKGIPRKNIKLLAGKPLIYYSIEAAKKSKYITRVVLSTEDAEIKQVATDLGCEVIDRPMDLAQDETKTAPVMLQCLEYLEKTENYKPDVVVLLQATCPTRDAKQIDEAFEIYLNNECDSVFAVKSYGNTHSKWRENHDGSLLGLYDYRTRPRRQEIECHYNMYCETGSIYIVEADVMKKVKDFIGETPKIYLSPVCYDIDTEADFLAVAEILNNK